uniref:Uncharacterized protein n=1 Tax=uncultured Acidobacteriales bacterium HF0200_23L05 TaxID=710732 RepID=E0XUI9_9BACT|nr:hypothetical protein [uncultured Acidobacteriales bacterium HF0200_23L05]
MKGSCLSWLKYCDTWRRNYCQTSLMAIESVTILGYLIVFVRVS